MPVGDWSEANNAQRTRQPPTRRRSCSLGGAAEPLVALARLLARQTAREVYRNTGAVGRRLTDPAR